MVKKRIFEELEDIFQREIPKIDDFANFSLVSCPKCPEDPKIKYSCTNYSHTLQVGPSGGHYKAIKGH